MKGYNTIEMGRCGMIAIGIGLSVLLIAYLCIQVYPFQEQKLEQGKYDGYGFWFILWTGCSMYISDHVLQESDFQWGIKMGVAILMTGIGMAFVGRQLMYDLKHKKLPFQRK
ncbi:hypothetical protein [Bacillus mycoides]|uniref:hypothetical protein n=1 Tax=Bacillus mycoides TaxID=1405 RepID=UPI003F7B35E1